MLSDRLFQYQKLKNISLIINALFNLILIIIIIKSKMCVVLYNMNSDFPLFFFEEKREKRKRCKQRNKKTNL
jgi:hypothetical protein